MADGSGMPVTLALGRSNQSGSYTLTGVWQPVYSDSSTQPYIFYGGWIDLTNMADGDAVEVRVRKRISSGGAWLIPKHLPFVNAQPTGEKLKRIDPMVDVYGLEISMRQTMGIFRSVETEWFPAKVPTGA